MLRPCRILLIEDDPDDVFLFRCALESVKAGLRRDVALELAGDGFEALCQVSNEDLTNTLPDVLVLDLNMPRLNGVNFLHELRAAMEVRDLPVFVLTTSTVRPVHEAALLAGANKVYVKPDSVAALAAIAAEIVELGTAFAQSRA